MQKTSAGILPRQRPLTLGEVIESSCRWLEQHDLVYGHGTLEAIDDAVWLALEAAGLSPLEAPDQGLLYPVEALDKLETWLHQRAVARIPTAYLVGRTWFAGYEFKTDARALVPRSPIAELINNHFMGLFGPEDPLRVLDLCTGGGCIALAVALTYPKASVVGSDLSAEALSLAAENSQRYQLDDRVSWVQGDLFEPVEGKFDLVLSNPPYVDAEDMRILAAEFQHEPALGLASGDDGLDFTRRMLAEARQYLNDGGILIAEVGNSAEALDAAYPELPFQWLSFENGGHGVFLLGAGDLQYLA